MGHNPAMRIDPPFGTLEIKAGNTQGVNCKLGFWREVALQPNKGLFRRQLRLDFRPV